MTDKMLKKQAFEAVDRLMGTFEEISDYVFKHPSWEEKKFVRQNILQTNCIHLGLR